MQTIEEYEEYSVNGIEEYICSKNKLELRATINLTLKEKISLLCSNSITIGFDVYSYTPIFYNKLDASIKSVSFYKKIKLWFLCRFITRKIDVSEVDFDRVEQLINQENENGKTNI